MNEFVLCMTCRRLSGCQLLTDSGGEFTPENLITKEKPGKCKEWIPIGWREAEVRRRLNHTFGDGSLRAVFHLPPVDLEEEGEDVVDEAVPDFPAMIKNGMTIPEREQQLRFLTDKKGNVLEDEDGMTTPRSTFSLRRYLTDPSGPAAVNSEVAMFWSPDQIINFILKAEKEAGWIVKEGSSNGKKQQKRPTTKTKNKEIDMGSRVAVRRVKKKAAPAEEPESNVPAKASSTKSKVAKPAGRKASKKPAKATEEAAPAEAAAVAVDLTEVLEAQAAHKAIVEDLEVKIDTLTKLVEELQKRVTLGLTLVHDVVLRETQAIQGVPEEDQDQCGLLKDGDTIFYYVGETSEGGDDEEEDEGDEDQE